MGLVITIALLGLLASVSPSTIVVFILLLATARARVNAVAFLIGWSISLTIVFAVSYAIGGVHVTQSVNGGIAVGGPPRWPNSTPSHCAGGRLPLGS